MTSHDENERQALQQANTDLRAKLAAVTKERDDMDADARAYGFGSVRELADAYQQCLGLPEQLASAQAEISRLHGSLAGQQQQMDVVVALNTAAQAEVARLTNASNMEANLRMEHKRPTIAELEKAMADPTNEIEIHPDGSVTATNETERLKAKIQHLESRTARLMEKLVQLVAWFTDEDLMDISFSDELTALLDECRQVLKDKQ